MRGAAMRAMLARAHTFTTEGLHVQRVTVEVDIRAGLPAFVIVGLADAAVREARERVQAAIRNCGYEFPSRRITASLAPADVRNVGPGLDLALACAVLAASGQAPRARLGSYALFGELSLDGSVHACRARSRLHRRPPTRGSPGSCSRAARRTRRASWRTSRWRRWAPCAAPCESSVAAAATGRGGSRARVRAGAMPQRATPSRRAWTSARVRAASRRRSHHHRRGWRARCAAERAARHGQDDARPADGLDPAPAAPSRGGRSRPHPRSRRGTERRSTQQRPFRVPPTRSRPPVSSAVPGAAGWARSCWRTAACS